MSEKNIMIVDTVEALEKRIEEVREAQRIFSTYSQEDRKSTRLNPVTSLYRMPSSA